MKYRINIYIIYKTYYTGQLEISKFLGTCWINHKRRRVLQHVVDRYGAYIAHVFALAQDSAIKAPDRAQRQGYLKKESCGKPIIALCFVY